MSSRPPYYIYSIVAVMMVAVLAGCSSTKHVPDDDQLYVGLTKIAYENYEKNVHLSETKEEVEAALACAPNGALFGSSFHRTPFPYGLWIWNAFSQKESGFAKWITSSFGKAPVLMSWVNPSLRAQVAQSTLRNHGYFGGQVDYEIVQQRNPKKAKIGYTVNLGHLYTLDSIAYNNFSQEAMRLIDSTRNEAVISRGDAFDISTLDAERSRISTLLRNNGYYYYQPSYASYLADTLQQPGKVQLRLQLADSIPEEAQRKWVIGKVDISLRRSFMEQLDSILKRRRFTLHYNGRRPPVRARVILRDLKLRSGQLYSYDNYLQSMTNISSNGLFSMVDFQFAPATTQDSSSVSASSKPDTLNLSVNCVFDKPYDFYVETNAKGKTSGFVGPELVVGLTKRNAFRGGEKLDVNLHGSYEWQLNGNRNHSGTDINTYEYGGDVSLELPRLLIPRFSKSTSGQNQQSPQRRRRRRYFTTPTTLLKASSTTINRSHYFKRHVVSGEMTYTFQTSAQSRHQISPLVLEYDYMKSMTDTFLVILMKNPYLLMAMQDQFIPKMRYTYSYTSPATFRHPIYWETTVSESANLLSTAYMAFGKRWDKENKKLFKNPYAQFLKLETDFRKTWSLGDHSQLVAHLNGGIIWTYGNSSYAPYTEQFYVGGANSIRAFTIRSIGPGRYHTDDSWFSYVMQTGDIKLLGNLEFRSRLLGNLYGAVFLDAGNVWSLRNDSDVFQSEDNPCFTLKNLHENIAVGTGVGLRYDLDFFVIRVDWGIGLHLPYDTGKSGYYNIPNFRDGQSIHLAIGYPF